MSASQRSPSDPESKKPVIARKSKNARRGDSVPSKRDQAFERQGVLTALENGLAEALPGLEVLDRNLEFDDRVRADMAVVDPLGRLLLVIVAQEDPQLALLETLDVLAYLRTHGVLIVRHLGSRLVDERLEPRVVLIDSANDVLLAERLRPLAVAGLRVFGVRSVRSSGGERSYLVASGEDLGAEADPAIGVQAFLDGLPVQLRSLASGLAQRMACLDEELQASSDENALIWRWHGMVLARLECSGELLRASIGQEHQKLSIGAPEHVELLLEEALACLLVEYERSEHEARDLPVGLGSLPGEGTEPLLSEDEIRAFHG